MPTDPRWTRRDWDAPSGTRFGSGLLADWREVDELIQLSDRLRAHSHTVQLAAARASVAFRKVVLRVAEAEIE